MIISTRIHGIPCQVRVTHYAPARPGFYTGAPGDCYPSEPAEVEFDVLDDQGRPDMRLESQMTDVDVRVIEQEAIAAMTDELSFYELQRRRTL